MKVACIQLSSSENYNKNFKEILNYINIAIAEKSDFIITPETSSIITDNTKKLFKFSYEMKNDPLIKELKKIAKNKRKWIMIGSLPIKSGKKLRNRSILINSFGKIVKYYDKINMFDVKVSKKENHNESKIYKAGTKLVFANTPWGKLGVTICYDIRFPHLYRHLAQKGAIFFTVPAAFARSTGKSHWHTLIRARAIENSCYIFAAAQCGDHGEGWFTYGHSLIVDPWGKVLVDGGDKIGFIAVEIDVELVEQTRRRIPSIFSDQAFT